MKLFSSTVLALALSAAHAAAMAAPVGSPTDLLIDFEGVTSFSSIGEIAPGVSFGGDALGLVNDEFSTFFTNAPSPVGVMTAVGPDATLNVADGFTSGLALFYSSSAAVADAVQIWSGLNGTGSLLASINLSNNAQAGCSDSAYCHFDRVFAGFSGTAFSVTFGNATYAAAFDNVHVGAVPEPESLALLLAGGGVALLAARRRRA